MAFLDTLVKKGVVKQAEADVIRQKIENEGAQLEALLSERGVSPEDILEAKSEHFQIPAQDVRSKEVPFKILEYVPEESAKYYHFVPIGFADGVLEIGLVDPDDIEARDAVQFIASKKNIPFKLFVISPEGFDAVVKQYKGLKGEVTQALSELETELGPEVEKAAKEGTEAEELERDVSKTQIIEEAPVTKIVAVILRHAIEGGASDIHIENVGDKVRVRFRVDGVMYTSLVLPASVHSAVVARIKILTSSMKLDEKRKPQDGRFSAKISGRRVDFRVSTLPVYYGEKVVMRILDPEKGVKKLEELGFSDADSKMLREAITRPYGIILLTGPTGSGKTTSLYSMLHDVDRDSSNVVSLEDPVEYSVPGVNQSQVRPEIGYTFASGLRSILRQDPDIIMVGEIRDKETAQLAIQAALTGHLVFSTLHTNNAAGVIPRLVDMGVDPFLIAPTLILAIAQRLARVICEDSVEPIAINQATRRMIEEETADLAPGVRQQFLDATQVHRAVPSNSCPNGTRGRVAVYEILRVDERVEEVILNNPVEEEVYKAARAQGMMTMKEDALLKTFKGIIPFEEVSGL